jgi:hypothetical protein
MPHNRLVPGPEAADVRLRVLGHGNRAYVAT